MFSVIFNYISQKTMHRSTPEIRLCNHMPLPLLNKKKQNPTTTKKYKIQQFRQYLSYVKCPHAICIAMLEKNSTVDECIAETLDKYSVTCTYCFPGESL